MLEIMLRLAFCVPSHYQEEDKAGNWTHLTTESSSSSWLSNSCVLGPNDAGLTSVSHWSGASWQPCRTLSHDLKVGHVQCGWNTGHQFGLTTAAEAPVMSFGSFPCTCGSGCGHFLLKKPLDAQILVCLPSCWFVCISAECIQLLKDCICTSWLSGGSCTLPGWESVSSGVFPTLGSLF